MSWLFALAVLAIIAWLIHACDLFSQEAVRLNLRVLGFGATYCGNVFFGKAFMAKLGDTFTATITPKNAAGDAAPVFNATYFASGGYSVSPAPDGLSCVVVADTAGGGFTLTCEATTKHGATLSQTVPLPDVDAVVDDEAVTLNLAVA